MNLIENQEIIIYNFLGVLIYKKQIENTQKVKINISQFPEGTYLLKAGKESKVFVKE